MACLAASKRAPAEAGAWKDAINYTFDMVSSQTRHHLPLNSPPSLTWSFTTTPLERHPFTTKHEGKSQRETQALLPYMNLHVYVDECREDRVSQKIAFPRKAMASVAYHHP